MVRHCGSQTVAQYWPLNEDDGDKDNGEITLFIFIYFNSTWMIKATAEQTPVLTDAVQSKCLVAAVGFGDFDSATPHGAVTHQLTVTVTAKHHYESRAGCGL